MWYGGRMGLTDALLLILLVQMIFASKVLLDIRDRLPRGD
jgi:hypothetical protein